MLSLDQKYGAFGLLLFLVFSCAHAPVHTSVDSLGESAQNKAELLFFTTRQNEIEDSLTLKECRRAALNLGFKVSEQKCLHCTEVSLKSKVIEGETVWTGSSSLLSSGGVFGDERSVGSGLASRESVKAKTQNTRELNLTVYPDVDRLKPAREIVVKSVGSESNVSVVAFELCKAALMDYPENLKNKRYDILRE